MHQHILKENCWHLQLVTFHYLWGLPVASPGGPRVFHWDEAWHLVGGWIQPNTQKVRWVALRLFSSHKTLGLTTCTGSDLCLWHVNFLLALLHDWCFATVLLYNTTHHFTSHHYTNILLFAWIFQKLVVIVALCTTLFPSLVLPILTWLMHLSTLTFLQIIVSLKWFDEAKVWCDMEARPHLHRIACLKQPAGVVDWLGTPKVRAFADSEMHSGHWGLLD
jgi:hypothetical protein